MVEDEGRGGWLIGRTTVVEREREREIDRSIELIDRRARFVINEFVEYKRMKYAIVCEAT